MRNWALVVGINKYSKDSGQKRLKGAVNDACDFAEWALDPSGGSVQPKRLFFWTYPWPKSPKGRLANYLNGSMPKWDLGRSGWVSADPKRAPDAQEIVHTGERIGRKLFNSQFGKANAEPNRIYVFLAGHGLRTTEVNGNFVQTCFIGGDFRPVDSMHADGLIPCTSFRRSLRNDRFDEVLLFVDCCRNKFVLSSLQALPICDLSNDQELLEWSIAHAATDQEIAYETPKPPHRGAFSQTLLRGLRTHRDPRTNSLTVEQLKSFVIEHIGEISQQPQTPDFDYKPPNRPLVLVTGAAPAVPALASGPLVHSKKLPLGTPIVLKDGTLRPVAGIAPLLAGPKPARLPALPDGLYSLEPQGVAVPAVLFEHPKQGEVDVG